MDEKPRTARDVMTRDVVTIGPDEKMSTVMDMMRKHRYSQIPVVKDGEQIGSICEKLVYNYLFRDFEDTRELMAEKVGDMMNSRLRARRTKGKVYGDYCCELTIDWDPDSK